MSLKILLQDFINIEVSKIPNSVIIKLDIETVKSNLSEQFKEYMERTNSFELATKFQNYCPYPGADIQDYMYKIVSYNDCFLWLSLRFLDRNTSKPFVEILYYSDSFANMINNIKQIKEYIISLYANITLDNIRILCYEEDYQLLKTINYEDDLLIIGRQIGVRAVDLNTKISIERISTITQDEYDLYAYEYDKFNKLQPELNFVHKVPISEILNVLKKGYGYKILKDQNFIGLFIMVEDYFNPYYGYCVYEKIVFEDYRGHNYSYIAQNLIEQDLNKTNTQKHKYIIGTISPLNLSSLRAAKRSGRNILMRYVMLKTFDHQTV